MNVAKSKDIAIPADEHCPLQQHRVYIEKSGLIYDASLNQTNASNNNNKFYIVQLLQNAKGDCQVWTRWGRVGDRGQTAILGDVSPIVLPPNRSLFYQSSLPKFGCLSIYDHQY